MQQQGRYKKNKKTGLVVDTSADFSKYMQEKNNIKALKKTQNELNNTKEELTTVKSELNEIKKLLQQLVNKEK